MRLFVAIRPPAGALAELDAAVARFRSARPELRWASPAGWHLTLAFLGEVGEDKLAGLGRRLARAASRHQPLRLSISAAGAFPSARRARVLWAGIQADPDQRALQQLAWSVAAAARRAGAPPPDEGRRYRPHLTLARCPAPGDLTALTQALASFRSSSWQASQIDLMRSYLGPAPRYEVTGSWPLGGSAEPATSAR